jgi:hypothetical protein
MTLIAFPTPVSKGRSSAAPNDAEKPRGAKLVTKTPALTVTVLPPDADGGAPVRELRLTGREAFALDALVRAGAAGCTPLHNPAPRWSDYIFKLRHRGISIETMQERHSGAFAGRHGRYVLKSRVRVIKSVGLGGNPQERVSL